MERDDACEVVFFGDSIAAGEGVPVHEAWVPRVSRRLQELGEERDVPVVTMNTSVSGETTRGALDRMPYNVQSPGGDVLVVQYGMNDCNYWETDEGVPRVSPDSFEANLREIFARARNFGFREILVNTNHPSPLDRETLPGTEVTYAESNRRYNELVREAARQDGEVTLVDVERAFEEEADRRSEGLEEFVLKDGVHLSVEGHRVYAETVGPVLGSLLKRAADEPDPRTEPSST